MAEDSAFREGTLGLQLNGGATTASTSSRASIPSNSELWQSGDYQELSSRFTKELIQAESSGDRQQWIAAANDLACAHRAAGDHSTAAYFQLLTATAERASIDEQPGRISATSMGNLACDAIIAGNWAVAESLLWKSLLTELATGTDFGIAADWANLGLLAALMGDFDAAQERLWLALKLHRREPDPFHLALDLWHLAQIFEAAADWTRSRKLYSRAAKWFATARHAEFQQAAAHRTALNAAREAVLQFDGSRN